MTASFTDTASMRDEAVKRVHNLSTQLAASIDREDALKSKLPATVEDLGKTCVDRANLRGQLMI